MNLIDLFKRQDSKSIQSTLDALASNDKVFSAQLQPIVLSGVDHKYYILDYEYYIYMNDYEVVFLLWDDYHPNADVLADEEFFYHESPLYFTENSHWTSPVHLLTLLIHSFKEVMRKTNTEIGRVYGCFLTNSKILNKEDMKEVWKWLQVVVIDNVNLHGEIMTNTDLNDIHYDLLMHFINNANLATWKLDPEYDHTLGNLPPVELHDDGTAKKGSIDELFEKDEDGNEGDDEKELMPSMEQSDVKTLIGVEIIHAMIHPMEQLNRLIGLEEIKKKISTLSMLVKYNQILMANGAKYHKVSLHSIFYGNPGTGKTIVGRIYASLLHEAGILSKGHVVLANGRQAFVGSLFGEEEKNVEKLLRLAQGGVLMIDEAYTLMTTHKDDPGKNVLPLLMKAIADETNRDFAVILTGYQKPIRQLLELNPGLDSRFPESNRFLFEDFSPEVLCMIAKNKFEDYGYTLTTQAWAKLKGIITEEYANRDPESFGNGRFVANLLEEIYQRHAVRCISNHVTELSALRRFSASDVKFDKHEKRKGARRVIGFNR